MSRFEMSVSLPVDASLLSAELLCMGGVNYELAPLLKMSAPDDWVARPITQWPVNRALFTSNILLLGLLPIDRHHFKFEMVSESGFKESSSSLFNLVWCHQRTISGNGLVKDSVCYQSKSKLLGHLLKPVYWAIFFYRHKRLQSKYGRRS